VGVAVRRRGQGGHGHRGTANYPAGQSLIIFPTAPSLSPTQGQVLAALEGIGGREQEREKGDGVTDLNLMSLLPHPLHLELSEWFSEMVQNS
jgi:hypothetical protein